MARSTEDIGEGFPGRAVGHVLDSHTGGELDSPRQARRPRPIEGKPFDKSRISDQQISDGPLLEDIVTESCVLCAD